MKKLFLLVGVLALSILGCKDNAVSPDTKDETIKKESTLEHAEESHGDHAPADYKEEWVDKDGKRSLVPYMQAEETADLSGGRFSYENPHGLAALIRSPYTGYSETRYDWGPPGHWRPWGGDWAGDFWTDNGNNQADLGWSCSQNVYIDAVPTTLGGQAPQSLKARLLSHGYACADHNFYSGGYAQKWEIIATYNGQEYALGWVLYAHLAYVQHTSVGTTINLTPATYIGKAFWGNYTSGCWGGCHIHMEFYNYRKYACFDVLQPTVGFNDIGILGGTLNSTQHCP